MNGRVYDPALGRFLSVDPFIQSPGDSQSLNPYGVTEQVQRDEHELSASIQPR
jgi:RHS repeat-associated protein